MISRKTISVEAITTSNLGNTPAMLLLPSLVSQLIFIALNQHLRCNHFTNYWSKCDAFVGFEDLNCCHIYVKHQMRKCVCLATFATKYYCYK